MWLVVSCLLSVAVVAVLAFVVTPDPALEPSLPRPAFAPGTRRGVAVQVVFASPADEDVVLDCIACGDACLSGGSVVHVGTPFTVRARRSCSAAWADAMIDMVLARWADEGTPVEMVVLDGPGGREVRLFDDSTRVQLPIAA